MTIYSKQLLLLPPHQCLFFFFLPIRFLTILQPPQEVVTEVDIPYSTPITLPTSAEHRPIMRPALASGKWEMGPHRDLKPKLSVIITMYPTSQRKQLHDT